MDTTSPEFSRPLRRAEAATYIQTKWGYPSSPQTLAKYATIGGGPVFRRAGRFPLYSTADLDEWVASKLSRPMRSTSDTASFSERSEFADREDNDGDAGARERERGRAT